MHPQSGRISPRTCHNCVPAILCSQPSSTKEWYECITNNLSYLNIVWQRQWTEAAVYITLSVTVECIHLQIQTQKFCISNKISPCDLKAFPDFANPELCLWREFVYVLFVSRAVFMAIVKSVLLAWVCRTRVEEVEAWTVPITAITWWITTLLKHRDILINDPPKYVTMYSEVRHTWKT